MLTKKLFIAIVGIYLFCALLFTLPLYNLNTKASTVVLSPTFTPFMPENRSIATVFIPPIQPTFGPVLDWPNNLDQAWQWIDEGHQGYVFKPCETGNYEKPFITWQMVKQAVNAQTPDRHHPYLEMYGDDITRIVTEGGAVFPSDHRLIKVREDAVFAELFRISIEGHFWTCGDEQGKPIMHGPGIQEFLDWIQTQ